MTRFFGGLLAVTLLALVYVHQRVGLIALGYQVEEVARERDEFLDRHRVLQYNVLTLRSPVILERRLAQRNIELGPPRAVEVVPPRVVTPGPVVPAVRPPRFFQRALRLAADWLGGGRQAVAQPAEE